MPEMTAFRLRQSSAARVPVEDITAARPSAEATTAASVAASVKAVGAGAFASTPVGSSQYSKAQLKMLAWLFQLRVTVMLL